MADGERREVLVVGAGLTGLSAAFQLTRGGVPVTVLEAAHRPGGVVGTAEVQSPAGPFRFELGPNTVLAGRPALEELITAAGLEEERLGAGTEGGRRYLWKGGRLLPLPTNPLALLTTPLLSARAKLRLLREPWMPPASEAEESIAHFVRRRLGPEVLDHAVGPFVSGVWAGDPERLTVAGALPRLAALEAEHGSLLLGGWKVMRGRLREKRQAGRDGASGEERTKRPQGRLLSFRGGLAALPERLAERIDAAEGSRVRLGEAVESLTWDRSSGESTGTITARTSQGTYTASDLILAVPADAAARLLEGPSEGASKLLAEIPHPPVTVVSLGVRKADLTHPLDGFGFLVPRREPGRILGCLFPSTLFPDRAPDGHAVLTVFVGGRLDPEAAHLPEPELLDLVRTDLHAMLGLTGEPVASRITRWPRAIPQIEAGHQAYTDLAARLERDLPGLHLAGGYLTGLGEGRGGISVPDRVEAGVGLAARWAAPQEGTEID